MLFYDVNGLEVPKFVDLQNEVLLVVAVKLLAEGEDGHLAEEIADFGTKLQKKLETLGHYKAFIY
jgi:hypothetical protein